MSKKWENNPKRALNLLELEAELENLSDDEVPDIAIIPPDCDELTDEEFIDDDVITGNTFMIFMFFYLFITRYFR